MDRCGERGLGRGLQRPETDAGEALVKESSTLPLTWAFTGRGWP